MNTSYGTGEPVLLASPKTVRKAIIAEQRQLLNLEDQVDAALGENPSAAQRASVTAELIHATSRRLQTLAFALEEAVLRQEIIEASQGESHE